MMFNPKDLRFCHASELKEGDVASLSLTGGKPCVVSKIGDQLFAINLDQDPTYPEWLPVDNLSGSAIVYSEVTFEVDPLSLEEDRVAQGDLLLQGEDLFIVSKGNRGPLLGKVCGGFEHTNGRRFAFTKWRAVRPVRDSEFVLFERKPA